jgi:hypothetical protein
MHCTRQLLCHLSVARAADFSNEKLSLFISLDSSQHPLFLVVAPIGWFLTDYHRQCFFFSFLFLLSEFVLNI